MSRRSMRAHPVIAISTAAVLLAGCAAAPVPQASTAEAVTSEQYVGDWGMVSYDVDPVTNTDQLLQWASVVATGRIVSFSQGRLEGATVAYRPVVAKVDHVALLRGELAENSDGFLYVALTAPAGPEAVTKAVPPGTPVLIYGTPTMTQDAKSEALHIVSGLPPDQELYRPVHPVGFVLQYGSAQDPVLVFPDAAAIGENQTLADAFPGQQLSLDLDEEG